MWTKYSSIISFVIDNDDVTAYLEQYNDLRLQNVLCTISERPKKKNDILLTLNNTTSRLLHDGQIAYQVAILCSMSLRKLQWSS